MNNRINSIHYLRGIAALLVVCFHSKQFLNGVLGVKDLGNYLFLNGQFGVDLFFVISGFIIAFSTHSKERSKISSFVTRRFFRIYPVFIVSLLICYLVVTPAREIDILSLVRSAFLIHTDYTLHGPFFGYSILYTAWTLTYEIYFYALFVVAMWISHRNRILISTSLIILPLIIIQLFYNERVSLSGSMSLNGTSLPFLNFVASPMMIEFIYGMLIYETLKRLRSDKYSGFILFMCVSFVFVCYFSNYMIGPGPLNYGTWGVLIIFSLITYEQSNTLGQSRILNALGDISYSMYLMHVIVIYVMIYYPEHVPMYESTSGFSRFSYMVLASIAASWLTFEYIEKPFMSIGKRLIKRGHNSLPSSNSL
ncbi:acyltransferase family protein [Erwinia sp. LJJL01]|uniref:acyltransferase family protein n=1 Tax=Erwinia sp. LJJL01 TaxID=3391839 RepID=UPI00105CE2C1